MTLKVRFPHSEILGSKSVCRLPEAYRRLPRPSSPLTAKASTACAYSLDHINPNGSCQRVICRRTLSTYSNKINILFQRLYSLIHHIFKELNFAKAKFDFYQKIEFKASKTYFQLYPLLAWWSQAESNRRPSACKADALPAELWPL
jgi:hypothetical protein